MRAGAKASTIAQQLGSLYGFLQSLGFQSAIQQYGIAPIGAEESRTYQTEAWNRACFSERVMARVTYFHNEFGNQIEAVSANARCATLVPNLTPAQQQQLLNLLNNNFAYDLDLNSMAYRAQGVESEIGSRLRTASCGLGIRISMRWCSGRFRRMRWGRA